MMLPTHALVGMLIALPVAMAVPEASGIVLGAGLLGGMFPDLDMYAGHRKTLHFPVYYSVLAAGAAVFAVAASATVAEAIVMFLFAAAVHSVSDILGGGLELHPWEATSERAVYDHHRDRWLRPRRVVGYDGSPGDLLLSAGVALPLWLAVDGQFRWVIVGALVVGSVYTGVRRLLPAIAIHLASILPERLVGYLPRRYRVVAGRAVSTTGGQSQES